MCIYICIYIYVYIYMYVCIVYKLEKRIVLGLWWNMVRD